MTGGARLATEGLSAINAGVIETETSSFTCKLELGSGSSCSSPMLALTR